MPDAPVGLPGGETGWLLEVLSGNAFKLLVFGAPPAEAIAGVDTIVVGRDVVDREGLLTMRLDARPGSAYLVRPDQHLCARMRRFDASAVRAALARAMGQSVGAA